MACLFLQAPIYVANCLYVMLLFLTMFLAV